MKTVVALAEAVAVLALTIGGATNAAAAVQLLQPQHVSSNQTDVTSRSRHLTAASQSALRISSLHDTVSGNSTAARSATGNLTGIKPGLPATCYGQPCSASACYPAATMSVQQYVNYINVTATLELDRQYNVRNRHKVFVFATALSPQLVAA